MLVLDIWLIDKVPILGHGLAYVILQIATVYPHALNQGFAPKIAPVKRKAVKCVEHWWPRWNSRS